MCDAWWPSDLGRYELSCFPLNLAKLQGTPFLTEHLKWLLLSFSKKNLKKEVLTHSIHRSVFLKKKSRKRSLHFILFSFLFLYKQVRVGHCIFQNFYFKENSIFFCICKLSLWKTHTKIVIKNVRQNCLIKNVSKIII